MSTTLPGARRAALNRWAWHWRRHAGWPGAAALLLLALAAMLAGVLRPQLAGREAAALREHVLQLDTDLRLAGTASGPDPRDALRASLPAARERGRIAAELMARLAAAPLSVGRVQYRSELEAPGLERLRVELPLQGGYGPLRALLARLLNEYPNAALDGLEIERPNDAAKATDAAAEPGDERAASKATAPAAGPAGGIQARLRLSLYFRRDAR